jgi:hypothetical protein
MRSSGAGCAASPGRYGGSVSVSGDLERAIADEVLVCHSSTDPDLAREAYSLDTEMSEAAGIGPQIGVGERFMNSTRADVIG